MKSKPLWKLSVTTTAEAEDAVTELLQTFFSQTASSYTDLETGKVIVSVYLLRKPGRFRPALIIRALQRLRQFGVNAGTGRVSLQRIRPQNWAQSWKRHFRPIAVGSALLIKPGWSKRRARKGQAVVVLDPGLSFGTGQHPTTAFCLEQLVVWRDPGRRQAFLDIGTGSGILAIAAARLGYTPVEAFDSDPEAVRIARVNARRNRVLGKLRIHQADLSRQPTGSARMYDLVCANLISDLLVAEWQRVISRLKPGGVLVLAGILRIEFSPVIQLYKSKGLKLVTSRVEKEWRSAAFLRV